MKVLSLWMLIAILLQLYFGGAAGPPHPSERFVAGVVLAGWIFPLWAGWIDRLSGS